MYADTSFNTKYQIIYKIVYPIAYVLFQKRKVDCFETLCT